MIPASSYEEIDKILNEENFKLGNGFAKGLPIETKTVGFVLFDQCYGSGSIKDLVGNLDVLNIHSGTDIHFFLCGVSKFGPNDGAAKELGTLDGVTLYHNAREMLSFADAFAKHIPNWKYGLGFELVLLDLETIDSRRYLDFSSAVFFKVDELIKNEIIERPTDLFGKLVKFARDGKFSSACAFREELKGVFGTNWLKGLILAMFPKSVGKLARAQAALGGGNALKE